MQQADHTSQARYFDIAGKDFLDEQEAAHYACVSYSHFRARAAENGLQSFMWMGKKVYRKSDIHRAMERARDLASGADPVPDSPSEMRTGFAVLEAANARHNRRRARRA